MLLVNIINRQNVLNVIIQDYFEIVGTIVNTLVIIYYLFIKKFMDILKEKSNVFPGSVNIKVTKL